MNDQARALLFVAALFGGGGFTGGRVTAPEQPAELRLVYVPAPPPLAESAPEEDEPPMQAVPIDPVTRGPLPPVGEPPVAEPVPLPEPRPKIEKIKPKPQAKPADKVQDKKPRRSSHASKGMPSCALVKREYERMNAAQRLAAYVRASPQEVAHGKRCLGM